MTIKSLIYQGEIYAGATKLACTIAVAQTGPLQLTVSAGSFTHTDGRTWVNDTPAVFDITPDAVYPTECKIEIGDIGGAADIWCASRLLDGIEEFDTPPGWNNGHVLVFPFVVPPGCTDLAAVDIFVLTVLPGFPAGTTAADWQVQSGGA